MRLLATAVPSSRNRRRSASGTSGPFAPAIARRRPSLVRDEMRVSACGKVPALCHGGGWGGVRVPTPSRPHFLESFIVRVVAQMLATAPSSERNALDRLGASTSASAFRRGSTCDRQQTWFSMSGWAAIASTTDGPVPARVNPPPGRPLRYTLPPARTVERPILRLLQQPRAAGGHRGRLSPRAEARVVHGVCSGRRRRFLHD